MPLPVSNRVSWDAVRVATLNALSGRPVCLKLLVACILVTENNVIASEGYNGPPPGSPHCSDIGCAKEIGKDCRGCHAEVNAIINCHGAPRKLLLGGTAYVSLFPCNWCAKALVQSGIKRVVYLEEYLKETIKDGIVTKTPEPGAMDCFIENGVKVEKWNQSTKKTDIIYDPNSYMNQPIPSNFAIYVEKWESSKELMDKYSRMGFHFDQSIYTVQYHKPGPRVVLDSLSNEPFKKLLDEVMNKGIDRIFVTGKFVDGVLTSFSPAELLEQITKAINQALADAK